MSGCFRILFIALAAVLYVISASAAERSFSIVFGNEQTSTGSLTNTTFLGAVTEGASYIDKVTGVVAVFPDSPDCIRLSSNSTNGKFNIWLSEKAQVVPRRIVLKAARYDNSRDEDASLMLNSETFYITSPSPEFYSLSVPSRPERTLTNLIVDADRRVYLYSVTVYYDDSQGTVDPDVPAVASPVIIPSGGSVSYGTNVALTCSTPGAQIFYTVDGTEPTSAALPYKDPFAIYHDLTVKAFAVCDGMNPSEVAEAVFHVRNPEATLVSSFDFSRPDCLSPPLEIPDVKESVLLDRRTFTDGDVAVTFFAGNEGNTHVRLYNSYDAGCDLRIYSGDCMTVTSLNPSYSLSKIEFELSESGSSSISLMPSDGEFDEFGEVWGPTGETVGSVDFTSLFQSRIKSLRITLDAVDGIISVPFDHDLQQVWYTIDGRRVPAGIARPGFYIRVDADGSHKSVIR